MKKALALLRQNELMVSCCVMATRLMVGLSMVVPILPLYGRTFAIVARDAAARRMLEPSHGDD